MTTTNTQFVSKEHYLAFRKAWSNAVNSDKAKSTVKRNSYTVTSGSSTTTYNYAVKVDGWITGAHHVLYNILRNRTFHRGFTLINKPSKIDGGHLPHLGLYQAVSELKHTVKLIKQEAEHVPSESRRFKKTQEEKPFWGTEHIDEFLAPFDGIVTREMLLNIEIPELSAPLSNCYGKGQQVAQAIINGARPRTYDDLLNLIDEVTK